MEITRIRFPEILATELLAFHRVFDHFKSFNFSEAIHLHRHEIDSPFRLLTIVRLQIACRNVSEVFFLPGGNGLFRSAEGAACFGPHFDKNKKITFPGDYVNFPFFAAEVCFNDYVPLPGQKIRRQFFADYPGGLSLHNIAIKSLTGWKEQR